MTWELRRCGCTAVSYTHLDVYKRQVLVYPELTVCVCAPALDVLPLWVWLGISAVASAAVVSPVSYTHLDVYKRQTMMCLKRFGRFVASVTA